MNRAAKTLIFWTFILISSVLLWQVVRSNPNDQRRTEINYSTFMADATAGRIADVKITGAEIRGRYRDGHAFQLTGPENPAVYLPTLQEKGVQIVFGDAHSNSLPLQLLGTWAPMVLLGALWFFMVRQIRRRNLARPPAGTVPRGKIDPRTGEMR